MARTILLSIFLCLLPCMMYCVHGEGVQKSPNSKALFMDPLSSIDSNNSDEDDESEFDFVGHKDSLDTVPNNDIAESAVKKDLVKKPGSSPKIDEEDEESKAIKRKDKIEHMDDYDDYTGTMTSLDHIQDDLLAVRDTITRHITDKQSTADNDDDSSSNRNKEQNLQATKSLIGLLYDFKGSRRRHNGRKIFCL